MAAVCVLRPIFTKNLAFIPSRVCVISQNNQHLRHYVNFSRCLCIHQGRLSVEQHERLPRKFHPTSFYISRQYSIRQESFVHLDPYAIVKKDLENLFEDIRNSLLGCPTALQTIAQYHFDGLGKAFRPMVVALMARACNTHVSGQTGCLHSAQRTVALISEMIHTASLVHDDVIDGSHTRRGRTSVHAQWGQRKAILAGDYILSVSSSLLARLGNNTVVTVLSQVLEDLVRGEFMQLGSKENETERFNHYIKKTFKKTASLIANSCKAVAILAGCSQDIQEAAFQYGRNIGVAFQLVDDLLDYTSCESVMGKPTTADLHLGLATAPVLFAAHQFPELNALIMRRFKEEGDVEHARQLVAQSEGLSHTRHLAESHIKEAVRQIQTLTTSQEQHALIALTKQVLHRSK